MPEVGEIKTVKRTHYYVWAKCEECGQERWNQDDRRDRGTGLCLRCYNKSRKAELARMEARSYVKSTHPKEVGVSYHKGYRVITIDKDSSFYPMARSTGQALEHRMVMANYLGRCLATWEIVHHKNGVRDDNRLDNLQLISTDEHTQVTILEQKVKGLELVVDQLKQGKMPE